MFKHAAALFLSFGMLLTALPTYADENKSNERYKLVSIKRDIARGTDIRTVNATMMLDVVTGKNWILDEVKGRWVPVGYHNELTGTDATIIPTP